MDNQSMHTAQELTDEQIESIAESLEHDAENLYGDNTPLFMADENNAAAALRDYVRMRKENAQLRTRLDAVVKMLEDKERATSCSDCGRYNGYPCADHDECGLFKSHEEFTAILRAARGEGSATRQA